MMGAHCPPVASGQEKYPLYQFGLGALKWSHSLEDPLEQGLPLSTSSAVLSNQPDLVALIYIWHPIAMNTLMGRPHRVNFLFVCPQEDFSGLLSFMTN